MLTCTMFTASFQEQKILIQRKCFLFLFLQVEHFLVTHTDNNNIIYVTYFKNVLHSSEVKLNIEGPQRIISTRTNN